MATAPTSISTEEGAAAMLNIDRPAQSKIGWGIFALIAGLYVVTQHWGHLLSALPYLFLLACPLMHIFMHHGHGHGGHHGTSGSSTPSPPVEKSGSRFR
jgi:hypothetical protein